MPWWNDPADEAELVDRWRAHRAKLDGYVQKYRKDPQVGRNLSNWADHAPMLPRAVLLSMAKANISPTSKTGKWAIQNALVALDTQATAKRGQDKLDAVNKTQPILDFLSDQGNTATIGGFSRGQRETLRKQGEKVFRDDAILSRIDQHKDLNPGPGGFGGVIHDVTSAADTALSAPARVGFAGLQAGYEGVQAGGRAALGGVLNVSDPRTYKAVPNASAIATGDRTFGPGGSLTPPIGTAGTPLPEYHKLGNIRVASSAEALTDPKQITLYNMIHGEDAGTGYFPGGQAHQTQEEAARRAAYVQLPSGDRSALTPGRFVGATIFEPGTKPYNAVSGLTDLGVALYADPANIALAKTSEIREARKLFTPEAAGAYSGLSKFVHGPTFAAWANSTAGQKVFDHLAQTKDIRVLRRQLGDQFPAELLAPLQDAKTADAVKGILEPVVAGGAVRNVPKWGHDWRHLTQDIRWFSAMPHGGLTAGDTANNLEQVERLLVTGKVDGATTEKIMSKVARTHDLNGLADVAFNDMNKALNDAARLEYGVGKAEASEMFRFMRSETDNLRMNAIDDVGGPVQIDGASIGEDFFPIHGPHLENELLNQRIPLPDMQQLRDIRHQLSVLSKTPGVKVAWGGKVGKEGVALGDYFMSDIWKPITLLRGAWTVRVIGEEQVRMASAGLDSIFHHPFSHIAFVTGHKGNIDEINRFEDALHTFGNFDDPFVNSLSKRGEGSATGVGRVNEFGGDKIAVGSWDNFGANHPRFLGAWTEGYTHDANSAVVREVARSLRETGSLDEAKAAFWNNGVVADKGVAGEGLSRIRGRMRDAKLWKDGSSERLLNTQEGSDAYIDSVHKRIRAITNDDEDLIDGLATSKYTKDGYVSKALRDKLKQMHNDGESPEVVRGRVVVDAKKNTGKLDRAVTSVFNAMMTVPTNKFSRAPAFKQFYWRKMEDLLPYMTEDAQVKMLKDWHGAGMGKFEKGPLGLLPRKLQMPTTVGEMDYDLAQNVAKGHGLDNVRKLLYDVSERGNSWDTLRLLIPFGEAFKEVTTRWAKLVYDNPRLVRRAQQGVYGAQGSGFFRTDPETGEQYFVYPLSGHLTRAITSKFGLSDMPGLDTELRGNVQSLNIIGNGLPSVGPVVQIPVAKFGPKDEKWDWLNNYVNPYGDAESNVMDSLFPGWAAKLRTGGWLEPLLPKSVDDDRLYGNAVKDAADNLASGGHYDLSTDQGLEQLNHDAQIQAKRLYAWRSMAQFVSPAAPQPVNKIKGKDGHLYEIYAVAKDYQRMKKAAGDDWSKATLDFVDKYGPTAYLALEPRGQRQVYGVPTTKQAETWRADHSKFADTHPDVYGYFAPQGGDFDYNAYQRAIKRGEIKPQDTDEWLRKANDRVASAVEATLRAKLPASPSSAQFDWLARKKAELVKQFPGYDPKGFSASTSRDEEIRQLRSAVKDRTIGRSPTAQAAKAYLTLRDKALKAAARRKGVDLTRATLEGKSVADLRAWLRDKGAELVDSTPEFTSLYDGVLSGEVRDDG